MHYVAHALTNTTGADACITAQLHYDCPAAPVGALHVAAYLDQFLQHAGCANHLGDQGLALPGKPALFSFTVPAGARFEIVVMRLAEVPECAGYWLELFGLPCLPPRLDIANDAAPGNVRLHWSTAYPGWRLQSVNSLNGPAPLPFQNVSGTPAVVDSRFTVTNTAPGTQKIYRLAQ